MSAGVFLGTSSSSPRRLQRTLSPSLGFPPHLSCGSLWLLDLPGPHTSSASSSELNSSPLHPTTHFLSKILGVLSLSGPQSVSRWSFASLCWALGGIFHWLLFWWIEQFVLKLGFLYFFRNNLLMSFWLDSAVLPSCFHLLNHGTIYSAISSTPFSSACLKVYTLCVCARVRESILPPLCVPGVTRRLSGVVASSL